jgi:hypothetical protein
MKSRRAQLAYLGVAAAVATTGLLVSRADAHTCCFSHWSLDTIAIGKANGNSCNVGPLPDGSKVVGLVWNLQGSGTTQSGNAEVSSYVGYSPGVKLNVVWWNDSGHTIQSFHGGTLTYPNDSYVGPYGVISSACQTALADDTYCTSACP